MSLVNYFSPALKHTDMAPLITRLKNLCFPWTSHFGNDAKFSSPPHPLPFIFKAVFVFSRQVVFLFLLQLFKEIHGLCVSSKQTQETRGAQFCCEKN